MTITELRDALFTPCSACRALRDAVAALAQARSDAARYPSAYQPVLLARGNAHDPARTNGVPWTGDVVTAVNPQLGVQCPACQNRGTVLTNEGRELLRLLGPALAQAAPPVATQPE